MRKLALVGIVVFTAGCPSTPFGFLAKNNESGPIQKVPTVAQLTDYLNNNSNRIQSVRYEDVTLTPTQGSQSINLRAQMVVQKPLNFRMTGDWMGSPMVDLGSNEQEFWWWIGDSSKKKGQPPPGVGEQLYCSYSDLREGRARHWKIPLEPQWVIEVLGMGTYHAENYKLDVHPETVDLVERTRMNGRDVRKVITFQRRPRQVPYPMVSDFKLLDDATGKLICSAHITEVHLDRNNTNAYLPRKVKIECPEMKFELVMKMDHIEVNPGIVSPGTQRQVVNAGQPVPMGAFLREPMAGIQSRNLAATGAEDFRRVQGEVGR